MPATGRRSERLWIGRERAIAVASEARTVVDLIPAHSVVRRGTKTDARSRAAETAMLSDPLPVRAAAAKHWSQQRTQFAWHRAISAARGTEEAPARPIFVLGCPRSGTSVVFALLQRHEALRSPGREGHALWNAYQHPRLKGWSSDRATHQDIVHGHGKVATYGHSKVSTPLS